MFYEYGFSKKLQKNNSRANASRELVAFIVTAGQKLALRHYAKTKTLQATALQ